MATAVIVGGSVAGARWRAAVNGAPAWAGSGFDGGLPTPEEIAAAARHDGVVWRRQTRMQMSLATPAELFSDEKFLTRVRRHLNAVDDGPRPPDRAALVHRVQEATGTAPAAGGGSESRHPMTAPPPRTTPPGTGPEPGSRRCAVERGEARCPTRL